MTESEQMCCEMNERNVHENVFACGRYGLKRAIGEGGEHSSSDTLTVRPEVAIGKFYRTGQLLRPV